ALGVVGLLLGVAGAAADVPLLGALAGVAAVGIALFAARQLADRSSVDGRVETLSNQVDELETALATQMQARLAAEESVRSLGAQLADAQRSAARPDPIPGGNEQITDQVTGLFSEDYFRIAVDS